MLRQFLDRFGNERLGHRRRLVANRDLPDLDPLLRDSHVRGHGRDLLRDANSLHDPREHRVLTVEGRLVRDADEELRPRAVAPARHEHRRDRAARVLLAVRLEAKHPEPSRAVLRRLRRVLRDRIAALDDPHRNHAMKGRPVVGAFARARDEVGDVVGSRVREQVEHDRPMRGLEDGLLALQLFRRQCRDEKRLEQEQRQEEHGRII
jgi:hypothetical protein